MIHMERYSLFPLFLSPHTGVCVFLKGSIHIFFNEHHILQFNWIQEEEHDLK